MTALANLARSVSIDVRAGEAKLPMDKRDDWQRKANDWRCTLHYAGRSYSFDFWQGVGIDRPPTVEGTLDCLLSDAQAGEMTYPEYCREFCIDEDSRAAHRTWRACRQTAKAMRRLLADDFEEFLYAERD